MPSIYGSITKADTYFGERLDSSVWEDAISTDRTKALTMATRAIDDLNLAGIKTVAAQELQFPRGTDTTVPVPIEHACFEIAIAFLDGFDANQEGELIGVISSSYMGSRTTYDETFVQEHVRAGIPSIVAWNKLQPFLRDHRQLDISRVN